MHIAYNTVVLVVCRACPLVIVLVNTCVSSSCTSYATYFLTDNAGRLPLKHTAVERWAANDLFSTLANIITTVWWRRHSCSPGNDSAENFCGCFSLANNELFLSSQISQILCLPCSSLRVGASSCLKVGWTTDYCRGACEGSLLLCPAPEKKSSPCWHFDVTCADTCTFWVVLTVHIENLNN